jgi:hypothetical protein
LDDSEKALEIANDPDKIKTQLAQHKVTELTEPCRILFSSLEENKTKGDNERVGETPPIVRRL